MPSLISPDIIGQREKFLIYGDPGTGKTFTSLTAPGPIYFLSVGGPNEAKTYYSKQFQEKHAKKKGTKIYIDVAEEKFGIGEKYEATGFDKAKELIEKAFEMDEKGTDDFHFETLVVDNATVLTEYQGNKAIELSNISRPPDAKGKSTLEKFQEDDVMKFADHEWQTIQGLMGKFISELFRTDKHIVFIAHEWEQLYSNRATQTQKVVAVKPLFVGKQRDRIANMFDNVWRMTQCGQVNQARTVGMEGSVDSPSIIAKTRVGGVLSDNLLDPDLTDVIKKFQAHAAKFKTS